MIDPSKIVSSGLARSVTNATVNSPASQAVQTRTNAFLLELGQAYSRLSALPATVGSTGTANALAPTISTAQPPISSSQPPANLPDRSLQTLVTAAARQEGVPPALLAAVVEAESGFQPGAVSSAGAKGLTQLMDGTASRLGVTNPFDPWQNLVGGARFLHQLIERYSNNYSLALAAYNAGPGAVDAAHGQIPPYPETQTYVPRVLALYQKYLTTFPS